MELFNFEKRDITNYIERELKTLSKFKEPLNFVIKRLEKLGHSLTLKSLDKKIDLNKVKEHEGKNYYWSVFHYKNATLVIRRYQQHLTIFTKVSKGENRWGESQSDYGAFTLHTDMDKFGDDKHDEMLDEYYTNPFLDLNVIAKDLFTLLINRDGGVNWVWNSVSLKRPKHVKLELSFCNKEISSIDSFVFCMEELENIYLTLFSESIMVQKLKELKTGDKLNDRYKVGKIITEVKDGYYHSVGFELIDGKDKNFKDVYCLSRYYFEYLFKDKLYFYDGVAYVQGGTLKVGQPVAYKREDIDDIVLLKDTFPKENFIALKKY